ncbi:bifunctional aspartate kinase/diaminopimelate decarboxylase [Dyella sp.]|uniref:bifunctional aspartate kinase/diaminopimelate decarboxylase n=1 Tax=Dyella sp. TaxID=1869338 RepID=UPI002ED5B411
MNSQTLAPLSADAPWIVMKFGGTSVATLPRWQNILELVSSRRAEGARVLIVVSALSGITDALKQMCAEGDKGKRSEAAKTIAARHHQLLEHMQLSAPDTLEARLRELARLAEEGPSKMGELAWAALVQAHGELMSSALGSAFLTHGGLTTEWVDARECLAAVALPNQNERTKLLSAMVEARPDAAIAARLAMRGEVFITQGFIAREAQGRTVLLGRGGSDTSASYFGALLRAQRVEIWTDVAGMFTANPRQVPGARLLQRLDYEEAQEIASTGAKVLHPRCLSPLREPRVPLLVKDTNRPELSGTHIGPELREEAPSIKAISTRKGITLVSMESVGMWQQVGFLADVFDQFKHHGLSVDLIGSAETNVTVSLDPTENLLDSDVLAALAADLAKVCRVKVIAPCAAVTMVGRGMRSMLHRLHTVMAEFGQHRVHMISQSSNNLNFTFVVDENVVDGLLPQLHEQLVRTGAMRTDDATLFGPSWERLYGVTETGHAPAWWLDKRAQLVKLAEERSPRYVYDLATVRERARALKASLPVDRILFAIKANSHPAILKALAEEGLGMECVSPGELDLVAATVPADTPRLFTPNFAPRADYRAALEAGVLVTIDALHPMEHWVETFEGRDISVRVDLGRGLGHHDKVRTGGSTSKFGVPLDQLDAFVHLAAARHARIVGLHAHLGSGVLDPSHWAEVFSQLATIAERIPTVEFLNLGGGLGVPSHPGERPLDLEAVGAALAEVRRVYPQYKLWMEPGRFLVAEAGVLLARVTQLKGKGAWRYLGVDAGMHNLIRPALYDAWHEIANLTRFHEPATAMYQVVGPICESGDVLGNDRRLPESREDDVILIATAGAYGQVMSSPYNLRGPAEEIVLD